jgi:ribosome modulation factor
VRKADFLQPAMPRTALAGISGRDGEQCPHHNESFRRVSNADGCGTARGTNDARALDRTDRIEPFLAMLVIHSSSNSPAYRAASPPSYANPQPTPTLRLEVDHPGSEMISPVLQADMPAGVPRGWRWVGTGIESLLFGARILTVICESEVQPPKPARLTVVDRPVPV